jgi:hypothetical protein
MKHFLRDTLSDEAFAILKFISTPEFHSFYLNQFEEFNSGEEIDEKELARDLEYFASTYFKKM